MKQKRNFISEILDTRSRALKHANRWQQFSKRNTAIIKAFNYLKKAKGSTSERFELLKYISIGSVACVEDYYRMVVRDLIEHGSPYEDNARQLQDIKFDLATILDMRREKISHGEFVAHLLPINNLEDINRNMSVLLKSDFLDDLKKIEIDLFEKHILEVMPDIFERINDLFRQRHIFCHEIAIKTGPTYSKEYRILGAATVFVFATETLLAKILSKNTAEQSK